MFSAISQTEVLDFLHRHSEANLWQSPAWGEYQAKVFSRGQRFFAQRDGQGRLAAAALVIEHRLRWGYCYWSLPRGPLLSGDLGLDQALLEQILVQAKKQSAIFVQLDPRWSEDDVRWDWLDQTFGSRLYHTPQPQTTLQLDLRLAPDQLLAQMKEKGRYNIRLAQRKGVNIRAGSVEEFYALLQETHLRDGFAVHAKEKYQGMLMHLAGVAEVFIAEYAGQPIAGGIFCFTPKEAIYYYGASANIHRNLMAPYLLQWHAICQAQSRGCLVYDFLGIAPLDAPPTHPWAGVTEFKTKFGGEVVHYGQPRMIAVNRPLCWVYRRLRGG